MPPRALLLDFDGVIADTENIHIAAWQRTFGAMGWDMPDEACSQSIELDDRLFLAGVFGSREIVDGNIEGWVKRKQELTLSLLADAPRLYPGVVDLVRKVKALGSVKLAVVTSTWRANVTTVLQATGLYPAFSLIVGKEDVRETKPDPAIYTLAIKSLGLQANEAVTIEDSATGLASANDAGVRALAVGHKRPEGAWVGKSRFIADLKKTDDVMAALGFLPG